MKNKKNLLKIATIGLATVGLVATPIILTSCNNNNTPVDPSGPSQTENYKLFMRYKSDGPQVKSFDNFGGDVLTIHKSDVNIGAGGIDLYFGIWNNETNANDTNSFVTGGTNHSDPFKSNLAANLSFVDNSDPNAFDTSNASINNNIESNSSSKWLGKITFDISDSNWDDSYLNKVLKIKWVVNDPNGETNDGQPIELSQTFTISFVA